LKTRTWGIIASFLVCVAVLGGVLYWIFRPVSHELRLIQDEERLSAQWADLSNDMKGLVDKFNAMDADRTRIINTLRHLCESEKKTVGPNQITQRPGCVMPQPGDPKK